MELQAIIEIISTIVLTIATATALWYQIKPSIQKLLYSEVSVTPISWRMDTGSIGPKKGVRILSKILISTKNFDLSLKDFNLKIVLKNGATFILTPAFANNFILKIDGQDKKFIASADKNILHMGVIRNGEIKAVYIFVCSDNEEQINFFVDNNGKLKKEDINRIEYMFDTHQNKKYTISKSWEKDIMDRQAYFALDTDDWRDM